MINLFYNYYKSGKRQQEIDFCLKKNKEVFDRVLIYEGRYSFENVFALSKNYPTDINVFCNSDIYFPSIELLNNIKEDECYALTRWNKEGDNIKFFDRVDSQDSWIFKGSVKNVKANFYTGMWGCDNRLLFEIKKAGYTIKNPSLSIKTIHIHKEDERNYERTPYNTVPEPYLTIAPCSL